MSECEVCAGQEYNGWPNRETWAVGLHLDNDYGLYEYRCGLVDVMVASHADWVAEDPVSRAGARAVFRVADAVESWVREMFNMVFYPQAGDGCVAVWRMMAGDVGSLWRVDWTRLAEGWVDVSIDQASTVKMEGDDA